MPGNKAEYPNEGRSIMMNFQALFLIACGSLLFFLGLYAVFVDRKKRVQLPLWFYLVTFAAAIWGLAWGMAEWLR